MWEPEQAKNPSETITPPHDDLAVGKQYTCRLTCPDEGDYLQLSYQLRVMDDDDYTSGDQVRQQKTLKFFPAEKNGNKLSGKFTVDPAWAGKTIRIGFADPVKGAGLGGRTPHKVS